MHLSTLITTFTLASLATLSSSAAIPQLSQRQASRQSQLQAQAQAQPRTLSRRPDIPRDSSSSSSTANADVPTIRIPSDSSSQVSQERGERLLHINGEIIDPDPLPAKNFYRPTIHDLDFLEAAELRVSTSDGASSSSSPREKPILPDSLKDSTTGLGSGPVLRSARSASPVAAQPQARTQTFAQSPAQVAAAAARLLESRARSVEGDNWD